MKPTTVPVPLFCFLSNTKSFCLFFVLSHQKQNKTQKKRTKSNKQRYISRQKQTTLFIQTQRNKQTNEKRYLSKQTNTHQTNKQRPTLFIRTKQHANFRGTRHCPLSSLPPPTPLHLLTLPTPSNPSPHRIDSKIFQI